MTEADDKDDAQEELNKLLEFMNKIQQVTERIAEATDDYDEDEKAEGKPEDLQIEIGLSLKASPRLRIVWGDKRGIFTPNGARKHALHIMEGAALIEFVAHLRAFLITQIECDEETADRIIKLFREFTIKRGFGFQEPEP